MSFAQLQAIWQEAERLGYDGATLFDVLSAPALEPWTALSALTATTERLIAIPLVLSNTYRHPALLAKMAASLDQLSGGRLVLGIGAGGGRSDHQAFSIPWRKIEERAARLEDAIRIMRFLWSGADDALESKYYGTITGPGRPAPAQLGGPAVLVGGHGERHLLRSVARVGDLSNMEIDLDPKTWERRKRLLGRYCDEEGRDPSALGFTHNATVIIGETDLDVQAGVERYIDAHGLSLGEARQRLAHAVVGKPEECTERLRDYRARGMSWLFLLFPDLPDLRSLQLFGERVLPAFQ